MSKIDLCFIVDTTGSMGNYLDSFKVSILEFIQIFEICEYVDKIGIMEYKDYCDPVVYNWSGWHSNAKQLVSFVNELKPDGGGDSPEAAKTAIFQVLKHINKQTLMLWYTDAAPHSMVKEVNSGNNKSEQEALKNDFDWVTLVNKLKEKNVQVWTLLNSRDKNIKNYYSYLSDRTQGKLLLSSSYLDQETISKSTVEIVLSNFGHGYDFSELIYESIDKNQLNNIQTEKDIYDIQLFVSTIEPSGVTDKDMQITKRFATDLEFRKRVDDIFDSILNEEMIICLTYNKIFQSLWRAICKERLDDSCTDIKNRCSNVISTLKDSKKEKLMAFIESSYNQVEVINGLIESIEVSNHYPAVTYERGQLKFSSKDLLAVTRSCDSVSLKRMFQIVRSLRISDSPVEGYFIPLAFDNKTLFSTITHLVVDGVMISTRQAVIFAMLIVYTGVDILRQRAIDYILECKGKWIKYDIPENFSYEFIKFALKVNDKMIENKLEELLTTEEKRVFLILHKVGGYKINQKTTVVLKQPFTSMKTLRPDFKFDCTRCFKKRSFTLMDANQVCGKCLSEPETIFDCYNEKESYWCECKTCRAHYAVEEVDKLKAVPKCHYCRTYKSEAPFVKCTECLNKFIWSGFQSEETNWKCPPCSISKPENNEIPINFSNYVKGLDVVFEPKSLWGMFENKLVDLEDTFNAEYPEIYNNKIIINVPEIKAEIDQWIALGKAQRESCMLCFKELNKSKIENSCSRKLCKAKACVECLGEWYSTNQPGKIYTMTTIQCPFCRCMPSNKIIKRYNRELLTIIQLPIELDHHWFHAWCMSCYQIKQYAEKDCVMDTDYSNLKDFLCNECHIVKSDKIFKECPSCNVMTEKVSGCNHITCPCGSHWCFQCRELSTYEEIYDHMGKVHGGMGVQDEDEYLNILTLF